MSVSIDESELEMALLNGIPLLTDFLISALDAEHISDTKLNFKFVERGCAQQERRRTRPAQEDLNSSESAALLAKISHGPKRPTSSDTCVHCSKHNDSARCYKTFPHLTSSARPARAHLHTPSLYLS